MTYSELLDALPTVLHISTLGGKSDFTIFHRGWELTVVNSKGKQYRLTESDWNAANLIRRRHPHNPWRTSLYSEPSEWFSYSLTYAAALLRHIEDDGTADRSPAAHGLPPAGTHRLPVDCGVVLPG